MAQRLLQGLSITWLVCLVAMPACAQDAAKPAATAPTSPPAAFVDLRGQEPVSGDAAAGAGKAAVCAACHGAQGVAVARTFPDLAGQSATYLYVQLRLFKDGQRTDPVMSGQAAPLSDVDMRDLASHFASLAPKPAGQADALSRGAQLFRDGDPTRGVPACQGCHGADALGPQPQTPADVVPQPAWSTFPHLRGQSPLYVTKQLNDYRSGARAGSSNTRVMNGVARTLGADDIQALSTYLGSL